MNRSWVLFSILFFALLLSILLMRWLTSYEAVLLQMQLLRKAHSTLNVLNRCRLESFDFLRSDYVSMIGKFVFPWLLLVVLFMSGCVLWIVLNRRIRSLKRMAQLAVIVSGVTAKTEILRSLQESRRQYATLLANISGIVYRCKYDRDWTMLFMSEGTQEVLGYTPEDFYSGRITYNEIIEKNVRERLRASWKEALAEQALFNGEYSILAKDGERKWVIERGAGVFDENGKLEALEGIIFDITERKKSEETLERFAQAIEQSRDAIVITNENGVVEYANSAIELLTGYDQEEYVGSIQAEFESPPIDSELYHSMWKTLYKGKTWEAHFPNRRKDGSLYTENIVISPVRDEKGIVKNFVCICRDVTQELKDAQERENLQNQLAQSIKMESVGRLAGSIAHDFNNILQAMLGYSEMALVQLPEGSPGYGDISSIQNASRRASELTKRLLVFSRRSKKNLTVFSVPKAIERYSKLLQRLIGSKVLFDCQLPDTEIAIKADRNQFEQILINLCINARDAVELRTDGRVILSVSRVVFRKPQVTSTGTIPPGAYASLLVKDNGCGISSENVAQLFEPFFTTKKKGKGTGLGLSIAYGIVTSSGGGILVESEKGQGTTFYLFFPESEESLTSEKFEKHEKPAQNLPRGSGEKILLVDDEEAVLLTTQRMLESLGYTVFATSSSLEAVKIAREQEEEISLILTDVIMPEMNGPDMIKQILECSPDIPYLYMSGYSANLLNQQGVPNRSIGNIHKPFSRKVLAEKISECLGFH